HDVCRRRAHHRKGYAPRVPFDKPVGPQAPARSSSGNRPVVSSVNVLTSRPVEIPPRIGGFAQLFPAYDAVAWDEGHACTERGTRFTAQYTARSPNARMGRATVEREPTDRRRLACVTEALTVRVSSQSPRWWRRSWCGQRPAKLNSAGSFPLESFPQRRP